MGCSVCEEFGGWCAGEETRTVRANGHEAEYCLFHAPAHAKWIPDHQFNAAIFARLDEARNAGSICSLTGTVFPGWIDFSGNGGDILPSLDLCWAEFSSGVSFQAMHFGADTHFTNARFSGVADFSSARFSAQADFRDAHFETGGDFQSATFEGRALFAGATFRGAADFWRAGFAEVALFRRTNFSDVAFFGNTTFASECSFEGADFGDVAFFGLTAFEARVVFTGCRTTGEVRFEDVDMAQVSLLGTDIDRFRFSGCNWPRRGGRLVLRDEWENSPPKRLEALYGSLKRHARSRDDAASASMWRYSELEMYRRAGPMRRYNPVGLTNLYKMTCGYGERPVRALGVLAGLFALLCIMVNTVFQTSAGSPPETGMAIDTAVRLTLFATPLPGLVASHAADAAALVLARALLPAQVLLVALTLRNKFRR